MKETYRKKDDKTILKMEEADEKKPLLNSEKIENHDNTRIHNSVTRRRFLLLCVVDALFFQTITIMGYLVNEWIQNTLKQKHFPSGEFPEKNFSACENFSDSNPAYNLYVKVQKESSHWVMYNNIAQQTTGCVSNIILSCYTDSYGRRFLFILSTISVVIHVGIMCIVIYTKQSFVYMVVSFTIEGLLGSCFAFITASFLYVADIFPEKKARVLAVTFVEATLLFTVMISGLVCGLLVDNLGFLVPALICLGMATASLVSAIFLIPETLALEHRSSPPSLIAALKRPFEFYASSAFSGRRLEYILLISAFAFGQIGMATRSSMETVYLLGMPFCWSPTRIGYYELARFGGQIFIGLGSVKLLQICLSNETIAIISTVFCFASYVVEGLASSEIIIYMVAVIAVFGFSVLPITRGILSTVTPPDKQGSLFASISAVEIITTMISSVTENSIYAATVSVINGFVFFVMAGYIAVDFILLVLYTCIQRRSQHTKSTQL